MFYDIYGNQIDAYDIYGNPLSSSGYKRGSKYLFKSMSITDENEITERSTTHVFNGDESIAVTSDLSASASYPSVTDLSLYQKISFGCNIRTNNKHVGIWAWVNSRANGAYGGNRKHNDAIRAVFVINGVKKYMGGIEPWVSGWQYYNLGYVGDVINKVDVYIMNPSVNSTEFNTLYLDSVEVGFGCNTPHVLINMDVSPTAFIESAGYELFKQYGFTATFDHHINDVSADVGKVSPNIRANGNVAIDAHWKLVEEGYDFGTYSGFYIDIENGGVGVPQYDDESKRALFDAHAERMWKVNNDVNIFAPSTIHSTGFKDGEEYNEANASYPFLIQRNGNYNSHALFSYLDVDSYREVRPDFIFNAFDTSSAMCVNLLKEIDDAVKLGQNLMIGIHQIEQHGATSLTSNQNIGYEVAKAICDKLKSYSDKGKLKVCTTAEFVKDVAEDSDLYQRWKSERDKSVKTYV